MDRNERIAAEEEKANTSIEVERIKNEKILKQAELKMEAKRAKRIANETDEQREARLLDEERINKKKEDDDKKEIIIW